MDVGGQVFAPADLPTGKEVGYTLNMKPSGPQGRSGRFGKGKSVPLQVWTGPEVSRKLRFPDFVTSAQDGGRVVSLTHRPPLHPRKYSMVLISVKD